MLERVRVAATIAFRASGLYCFAENLRVDQAAERVADEVVFRFNSAFAAGSEFTVEAGEVKVPLDWWQAVRQRWAPTWWLRRWPVRFLAIPTLVKMQKVCPHVHAPMRDHFIWLEAPGGTP